MIDVIKPERGETVVVSAAAGATGSLAGQIAKLHGARIVGIASGEEKTRLLTERLRFDVGVDRKSPDFEGELLRACPDGISAYFDNTQGEVLDACLPLLVKRGRVAMCGGVAVLNSAGGRGNYNLMHVIWKRARLEGFSIFEYSEERRKEALGRLASWVDEGALVILEDNLHGFEVLPSAFIDLLAGRSVGRQLVWIERSNSSPAGGSP
jgi:NADPH-dependent curcumin reductase CurA